MNNWGESREVEKPKPIKLRAAYSATELIQIKDAVQMIIGSNNWLVPALEHAILVLQTVAGKK